MSKIGVTFRGFWVISFVVLCFCNAVHGQGNLVKNLNPRRVHKTLANIFRTHRDFQSMNGLPNDLWIPPGSPGKMPDMMNFPMFNPEFFPGGRQPMPGNGFQFAAANHQQPIGSMAPKNDRGKENAFNNPHHNVIQNGIQEAVISNQKNFKNFNNPISNPMLQNLNGPNRPSVEDNNQQRFPRRNQQGFPIGPPQVQGSQEQFQNGLPQNLPFQNQDQSQNRPFHNQGPPLNKQFPSHGQSHEEGFFNGPPRNLQLPQEGTLSVNNLDPFLRNAMNKPGVPQGGAPHPDHFPRNPLKQSGPPVHQMHQQQQLQQQPHQQQLHQNQQQQHNQHQHQQQHQQQQQQQQLPPQKKQQPQKQQQHLSPQQQRQQSPQQKQQQHQPHQQQHQPHQQQHQQPQQLHQQPQQQQQQQDQHQQPQHQQPQQQQQQQDQHQQPQQPQQQQQQQHHQQQQQQQPQQHQPLQQQSRFHRQPNMLSGLPNEFPPNQVLGPPFEPHDQEQQNFQGPHGPFSFRNNADALHQQQFPRPPDAQFEINMSQRPRKNPGNQQRGPPPSLDHNHHIAMQDMPFKDQNFQQERVPFTEVPNDLPPIMSPGPFLFPPPPPMGNQLPSQQSKVPKVFSDFPSEPVLDRGPWIPITNRPHFDWRPSVDGRFLSENTEEVSVSPTTSTNDTQVMDDVSKDPQHSSELQSERDQLVFESERNENGFGLRSNIEQENQKDHDSMSLNPESSTEFSSLETTPSPGPSNTGEAMADDVMAMEDGLPKDLQGLFGSMGEDADLESLLNELQQGSQQQQETSGSLYRNQANVRGATGRDSGIQDGSAVDQTPLSFDKHFRGSLTPNLKDLSVDQLLQHFQTKFDEGMLTEDPRKEVVTPATEYVDSRPDTNFAESKRQESGFPEFEPPTTSAPPADWSQRTVFESSDSPILENHNVKADLMRDQDGVVTPEPGFDGQLHSPSVDSVEMTESPNAIDEISSTVAGNSKSDLLTPSLNPKLRRKTTRLVLRRRKFPKRTVSPLKAKRYSIATAE